MSGVVRGKSTAMSWCGHLALARGHAASSAAHKHTRIIGKREWWSAPGAFVPQRGHGYDALHNDCRGCIIGVKVARLSVRRETQPQGATSLLRCARRSSHADTRRATCLLARALLRFVSKLYVGQSCNFLLSPSLNSLSRELALNWLKLHEKPHARLMHVCGVLLLASRTCMAFVLP